MTERVALVTGAGSGIGRASALALVAAGFHVALVGRRAEALEETLALAGGSSHGIVIPTDVTQEAEVEGGFDRCVAELGRLDLLFNNAGMFGGGAPFEDIALADWQAVMDVNLTGAFLCARAAYKRMKAQAPQGGRIINCGSISAHVPRPQAAAYTASKHAITGLTRTIALEGRGWNIACGQIDIGNAATELTQGFSQGALQPNGTRVQEPTMDVRNVAEAVRYMAELPLEANVPFMTVMATAMPYIGRG